MHHLIPNVFDASTRSIEVQYQMCQVANNGKGSVSRDKLHIQPIISQFHSSSMRHNPWQIFLTCLFSSGEMNLKLILKPNWFFYFWRFSSVRKAWQMCHQWDLHLWEIEGLLSCFGAECWERYFYLSSSWQWRLIQLDWSVTYLRCIWHNTIFYVHWTWSIKNLINCSCWKLVKVFFSNEDVLVKLILHLKGS